MLYSPSHLFKLYVFYPPGVSYAVLFHTLTSLISYTQSFIQSYFIHYTVLFHIPIHYTIIQDDPGKVLKHKYIQIFLYVYFKT